MLGLLMLIHNVGIPLSRYNLTFCLPYFLTSEVTKKIFRNLPLEYTVQTGTLLDKVLS